MIVVPQGHQVLKYLLLGIYILQISFMVINKDRLNMNKTIFILFLFYAFVGLSFGCYGLFVGNPGASAIMKLTIFYLFISMFFVMGINNIYVLKRLNRIIIFSSIFLSIYIIISILNANSLWPDWLYYDISGKYASQGVSVGSLSRIGRFDIGFSSLPSYLFLQPYLFTFLLVGKTNNRKLLWVALILSTFIMAFSGARILLIIGFLFPLLIVSYLKFFSNNQFQNFKNIKHVIVILCCFIIIASIMMIPLGFRIDSYFIDIINAFRPYELTNIVEGGTSASAYSGMTLTPNRRVTQFGILLSNWWEKPLFGFGSGSVAFFNNGEQYLRSSSEPWKYELTYMQFLHHWGIVGIGAYILGFFYTFKSLIKIFNKDPVYGPYALAAFFGSFAFLIGSSINPYITRFDSIYTMFIPIAIMNAWYVNRRSEYNYFNKSHRILH